MLRRPSHMIVVFMVLAGLDGMEVRAGASPHVIVGCRAGVGPGR